jgi:hypothetical protein
MTMRGSDFLQDWIAKNVTASDHAGGHQRAEVLAQQFASEAAAEDIVEKLGSNGSLSVTAMILEAALRRAEPRTPGD